MNGLVRNCAAVMYDGIRGLSIYMPHCTADMVGKSDSLSGHKCHVRSAMEKKNRPVDRRGAGFSRTLPSGWFPAMPGHLSPCTIICLLFCNRVFFRSGGSSPVSFVSVSAFRQVRCPSCNGRRSVTDETFRLYVQKAGQCVYVRKNCLISGLSLVNRDCAIRYLAN